MGEKEKREEGHHHTLCAAPVLRGAIKPRGEPALGGITAAEGAGGAGPHGCAAGAPAGGLSPSNATLHRHVLPHP